MEWDTIPKSITAMNRVIIARQPVYAMRAGQTTLYLNAVESVMSRAVVE